MSIFGHCYSFLNNNIEPCGQVWYGQAAAGRLDISSEKKTSKS